jgi:hypothetical protein
VTPQGEHASARAPVLEKLDARLVRLLALASIVLIVATTAWAQRLRLPEGLVVPPRYPTAEIEDGNFRVCKIIYTSVRREANGMGWSTDWPYAGRHLMIRVSELTKTRISKDAHGDPNHWSVRLTDDALLHCPFTTASDVGTLQFSPEEVTRLRQYLLKGGFLWVDDFWGTAAWNQWASEIHRVLPEFPIFDIPAEHPIRHMLLMVTAVPQVPGVNVWLRTGQTSERGADSTHPNFRAIADDQGRIIVLMTHNTDISDSWEREGEDSTFFARFSPSGYALGINVVLYALTH